jgi:formylglycine-generating enzyme required for sulfatase activity
LDVPKLHRAHTESMVDWDGSRKSAAFRNLVENIRVVAGASKPAPEVFESPSKPVDEPQQRGISPPVRSRDSMSSFRDRLRDGGEGPAMVIIPAGSFWMGSFENLREIYEHRRAPHEVTFSRPFALGKRPVTFSEYDRFAKATGKLKPNDGGWGRGPRPVINVSWTDADVYADWLCEQSGRRFRLPSEAEWEYACRGGTQTQWFFGDEETDIGEYAWFAGNSGKRTHPAGQKKPNPWGLHDVHGNVLEWVQDCWHENYHRAPTDGSAWIQGGDCERRVVRGGSWYDVPAYLCSAKRDWNPRKFQSLYLGFRLALDLDK